MSQQIIDFFDFMDARFTTGGIDYAVHIINILIVIIFFYIRYISLTQKHKDNYCMFDYITMVIMSGGIGGVLLVILGNKAIIFSHISGSMITMVLYKKYLNDGKKITVERKLVQDITQHENENDPEPLLDVDITVDEDIDITSLDILSILEIYGYISHNQKVKLISESLFETPDDVVHKLLKMVALEEHELKEAKAILNLIRLEKRLISKEELVDLIDKYTKK